MRAWFGLLRRFWRGLCTNWIGTTGVVLTTTSFALFLIAELMRAIGLVTNAYVGLLTYLALPALFVFGLLLIPIGWWRYRKRSGRTTRDLLSERFDSEFVKPTARGSRVVQTILLLTLVNVLFLGFGGARMLKFMDEPRFCGTACHSVMGPEWATYQDSPHARVKCVQCHVGEGAGAAIDAKLNGLWQMISVTFNLYERPIPAPVHNLRPARETCEKCHWPSVFYGDRIKRIVRYAQDATSTPRYSTLALKVGSGRGDHRGEIHWHVAAKNEVRYEALDAKRDKLRWVDVRQPDGHLKRYRDQRYHGKPAAGKHETKRNRESGRRLDCVDCHNRATHIYQDPEDVVDQHLTRGKIDRALPFAKRQALGALTGSYSTRGVLRSIEQDFRGFYQRHYPKVLIAKSREIATAIAALQKSYQRNIHPRMNIGWNAYPSHIGHRKGGGCMRCHNRYMVDDAGKAVPHGCTLCHSLLSYEGRSPFSVLRPPDPRDPECRMHVYLRHELTGEPAPAVDPCVLRRKPAAAPLPPSPPLPLRPPRRP